MSPARIRVALVVLFKQRYTYNASKAADIALQLPGVIHWAHFYHTNARWHASDNSVPLIRVASAWYKCRDPRLHSGLSAKTGNLHRESNLLNPARQICGFTCHTRHSDTRRHVQSGVTAFSTAYARFLTICKHIR